MSKFYHKTLFLFLLQTPTVVLAQDPSWIDSLIFSLVALFPLIVNVLIGVALVVFLIGIVRFIFQSGNEEAVKQGKQYMVWGIVALFVLMSVWGLVRLLQYTVGITSTTTPTTPVIVNPL